MFSAAGVQGERDAANPVDSARLDTFARLPRSRGSYFRGMGCTDEGFRSGIVSRDAGKFPLNNRARLF